MSKRRTLQRHRLIISKLRRGYYNFKELFDFLEFESDIAGEDYTCSLRTFQRDIKEIESLYNVEICYSHTRKAYGIVEDGRIDSQERLLEAFEIFHALNMSSNLSKKVMLENRKPSGTENLHHLLQAIRKQRQVSFDYLKFKDTEVTARLVSPIAIKESGNRWYLLGEEVVNGLVKSFGLERISNLVITNTRIIPIDYDPEVVYKHSFGMYTSSTESPKEIILRFTPTTGNYIKSLPLHHSQNVLYEDASGIQFSYFLLPSHDFVMEILSHGNNVEVLEPKALREEVKRQLKAALKKYS